MPFTKRIDQDDPSDTEGNSIRGKGGIESGENEVDTEGQGIRVRVVEDGSDAEPDDTEGQGARFHPEPSAHQSELDDTEGNVIKARG